jgi:hypothetical protein
MSPVVPQEIAEMKLVAGGKQTGQGTVKARFSIGQTVQECHAEIAHVHLGAAPKEDGTRRGLLVRILSG